MPTQEANDTCTLGAYPVYAVNISSVEQIQQTIAYARTHNLRLVIKNTGHCYLGKSGGAGALSVWTHNLKDIELVSEYSNANYTGPAFRVGAGVTVREIYEAAHSHGYVVPGGICEV
jgi:FAD/FMN-containing dehydrogenase